MFYKYVCDYILGNITVSQLIDASLECVSNGVESDNLYILAGMNKKNDNYFDIFPYYKLALNELNIKEPSKIEAVKYLIKFYCNELIDKKMPPKTFLDKIKYEIYDKTINEYKDIKYLGDYFGIEKFLMIFYSIDDIKYDYDIKNKIEEIEEEYKLCYKEAEKYLNIIK